MNIQIIKPTGRVFTGGDTHGELQLLLQKLKEVGFDKSKDIYVATGDLIDRGPDSLGCLKLLEEDWFYSVMGNHEDLAYKTFHGNSQNERDENFACWIQNGGNWYFDLDEDDKKVFHRLLEEQVASMPYLIEIQLKNGRRIGICHACVPGRDWNSIGPELTSIQKEATLWHRGPANDIIAALENPWDDWEQDYHVKNIDEVYLGHTPARQPFSGANLNFIDTGAFHTGVLTVIEL
ncbi:metallophosphoesterase [Vibrio harveyi]|uniref:metallophosphoesterase n=1 Tax=Vibrio harveyi TaxID=669 RepID=UPI003CEAC9D8